MGADNVIDMSRWALLVLVLGAVVALCWANETSCGADQPSKVADCDHPDLGSCGNSCCIMDFHLHSEPAVTHSRFVKWLQGGGPDKSFKYVTGPDSAGHNPGDDLRQYNISWQFIWQGEHTTTGGYVDKIDFNVQARGHVPGETTGSLLRISTISGIHGALGDNGQTYKTLAVMLGDAKKTDPTFKAITIHGCGQGQLNAEVAEIEQDPECMSCSQAGDKQCVYSQCGPVCDPKTLLCYAGPV